MIIMLIDFGPEKIPYLSLGTSPFIGAGQFGSRGIEWYRQFFHDVDAMAELMAECCRIDSPGGVHAIGYDSLVEAATLVQETHDLRVTASLTPEDPLASLERLASLSPAVVFLHDFRYRFPSTNIYGVKIQGISIKEQLIEHLDDLGIKEGMGAIYLFNKRDEKAIEIGKQTISLLKKESWFKRLLTIINCNIFYEGDVKGIMGIKIARRNRTFEITEPQIPEKSYASILEIIEKHTSNKHGEWKFEFWWNYVDVFEGWSRYYRYSLDFLLDFRANHIELVAARGKAYDDDDEERCPACNGRHCDYFDEKAGICENCGYQGTDLHLFLLKNASIDE